MKTLGMTLILMTLVCGCLRTKSQQSITSVITDSAMERVHQACNEIKATGDMFKLTNLIEKDMQEIMHVLDRENIGAKEEQEVLELADTIQKNSEMVQKLSQVKWNNPEVDHIITWQISDADFPYLPGDAKVSDAKIHTAYFAGEEREDLVKKISIERTGNRLTINFQSRATILEFCQLNQTLMIVVEVKYKYLWKIRSRLFALNIRKEML